MIDPLKVKFEGSDLVYAGLPSFTRIFLRDSFISGILMDDQILLKNHLVFAGLTQGTKKDSFTGEELGKIFHENPGVVLRGLSTFYNACDTTALYLIAFKHYMDLTKDNVFLQQNLLNLKRAVDYILSHLKDYTFVEDPSYCGGDAFALTCTYWKDAQYLSDNIDPSYPVVYPLVHAMNMCALRCAKDLLQREDLQDYFNKMRLKLLDYWDDTTGMFSIAVDNTSRVAAVNSDSLQMLFFLEKGDLPEHIVLSILAASEAIESDAGYRALDPSHPFILGEDSYDYPNTVWPFEQALINMGARKFGLSKIIDVSSRVVSYLDTYPEYLLLNGRVTPAGCDPQLWTIAAKIYFSGGK